MDTQVTSGAETPLEWILTHSYKAEMIAYMREHPEAFAEAVTLATDNRMPYSWRAAWLLWSCLEPNDPRLRRHYGRIVRAIGSSRENQQRELFKILQMMDVLAEYEAELFDACVSAWENLNAQPSVRVNALKLLVKIAERHPDLFREVILLTGPQYLDTLSTAVRKSVIKIMKSTQRIMR